MQLLTYITILFSLMFLAHAQIQGIIIEYCSKKNWKGDCATDFFAYTGGPCHNIDSWWNDRVSSYRVQFGCCNFYEHGNCQGFMFTADRRSHWKLGKHHNDKISSWKCHEHCDMIEKS